MMPSGGMLFVGVCEVLFVDVCQCGKRALCL